MPALRDETSYYIEQTFSPSLQDLILKSFDLFEELEIEYYEDKYYETVIDVRALDASSKDMIFLNLLRTDLVTYLERFGIIVDEDNQFRLADLLELLSMLVLIPKLEDLQSVKQVVNSAIEHEEMLLKLSERYTTISPVTMMESVSRVKEELIEALRRLTEDVEDSSAEQLIDPVHLEIFRRFTEFIDNHDCLALQLVEEGYSTNLTLLELVDILPYDLSDKLEATLKINPGQALLDIASILVFTGDECQNPLNKWREQYHYLLSEPVSITKVSNLLPALINDFETHLKVSREKEILNENN